MVEVRLLGQILPAEPALTISNLPEFSWLWQEQGFTIDFKISIQNSKINVLCSLPDFVDEYLVEVHRRAYDLVRAAVGLAGFSQGHGLIVVIDALIKPDGTNSPIRFYDARLPPLCTVTGGTNGFDQTLRIVATEPILIRHLSDLVHAITVPHETPMSCARAVDGIKNLMAPDSSEKAGWKKLQEELHIDESYLKFITDSSKDGRHGKDRRIEGAITTEVAVRAWNVMNRYLEYRKRDNVLPLAEFPLLRE